VNPRGIKVRLLGVYFILALGCSAPLAQESVFPRMVGEWIEPNTSTSIIIKDDGSVFNRNNSPI
jgi:hypothetical protein